MQNQVRKKSPRAPAIAIDQALERALRVYEQERLHDAPVEAVAQALGFKNANNGSALTSIASLRYFGMLHRPKEGFLSVSKSIESYKYAPNEEMRNQIAREFLKTPALYQELLSKYPDSLPSPKTLKYDLIQKGFLPQAVETILSAFQQSVAFVKYYESNKQEDRIIAEEIEEGITDSTQTEAVPSAARPVNDSSVPQHDRIPVRLSGGRRAWIEIPTPFYESDKERLKAQIEVLFADGDSHFN